MKKSFNFVGMEEWSCHFLDAVVDQLELDENKSFIVRSSAHIMTIISSRQAIQDKLEMFLNKAMEDTIDISDVRVLIKILSSKHFELVLNKLENMYNSSVSKKNKFLTFIKEKLNEDKKSKETILLFSCLEESIRNAPLKELEFCADGISKKFLYPSLFNVKESKDRNMLEPVLDCVRVLAETSLKILEENADFRLSQKAELVHSALGIIVQENMGTDIILRATGALTSLILLPPR